MKKHLPRNDVAFNFRRDEIVKVLNRFGIHHTFCEEGTNIDFVLDQSEMRIIVNKLKLKHMHGKSVIRFTNGDVSKFCYTFANYAASRNENDLKTKLDIKKDKDYNKETKLRLAVQYKTLTENLESGLNLSKAAKLSSLDYQHAKWLIEVYSKENKLC